MRQQNNGPRRNNDRTPQQKILRMLGFTKHAITETLSYLPLTVLLATTGLKIGQTLSQFVDPKLYTPSESVYTPERDQRERGVPAVEQGISYKTYSADDDSIMRAYVIQEEIKRVATWYRGDTILHIPTDKDTLDMPLDKVSRPLKEYKAEDIVTRDYHNGREILMSKGRSQYIKFMLSSMPGLREISMHFGFNQGTKEEKVKKIAAFLQTKENTMGYRHDLALLRGQMDTTDYMRKPIISILEGLQNGGFQGDCEDFATNFIALSMASGIPHDDMCLVVIPGHAFVAVKNYDLGEADYRNYYLDDQGNKLIPIEATINAMPVLHQQYTSGGDIVTTDVTYERTPTIGRPHDVKAHIWDKKHPNGFYTTLRGSRR